MKLTTTPLPSPSPRTSVVEYATNDGSGAAAQGQDYMRSAYAYDPYMAYGGVVAYGQQTVVAPHVMGGLQARSISRWSPYDRVGVVNADP